MVDRVWYVSYGSNMSSARLACYLRGGVPAGGRRANPGARDPRAPGRSVPVDLPGTVYFAGDSPQWGGGVAFYDHLAPGRAAGRGFLVSVPQLADIAAQEMHRPPGRDDVVETLLRAPLPDGRHELGPGHYETLVEVGRHDGLPLLTLTSPHGVEAVEQSTPSAAYLATMAQGLRESRGWDAGRVTAYLDGLTAG